MKQRFEATVELLSTTTKLSSSFNQSIISVSSCSLLISFLHCRGNDRNHQKTWWFLCHSYCVWWFWCPESREPFLVFGWFPYQINSNSSGTLYYLILDQGSNLTFVSLGIHSSSNNGLLGCSCCCLSSNSALLLLRWGHLLGSFGYLNLHLAD